LVPDDPPFALLPCSCGIAHNHVRNFVRKKQRNPIHLDADVIEAVAERGLELHQHNDDRVTALRECIAELSEQSRNAIEHYYNGKSVERIAKDTNKTANSIYKLLRRSREFLHNCIKKRLSAEAVL